MQLIDENAFGILVALYDLEAVEYAIEEGPFVEYLARFYAAVEEHRLVAPLASGVRAIPLGHALYLEFADGDQLVNPITWVRELRSKLVAQDIPNICVLSAGGRWVSDSASDGAPASDSPASDSPASDSDSTTTVPASSPAVTYGPSEPMRKSLAAEAHAQPLRLDDGDDTPRAGFGPGLYVEKEAIEQAGKSLKNTPTALPVLSSVFYRIGG